MVRAPLVGLLLLSATSVWAADADFVSLFDGKTLKGWKQAGGNAVYRVEDGCIVGEVPEGGLKANSFLCTEKHYANFVFECDAKLDVPLNSGIQFRSHAIPQGRVFGYQC